MTLYKSFVRYKVILYEYKGSVQLSFKRDKISYAVGQRIKMFRTERKISQEELALLSDIYPAYLGRLERGERCPTVETIHKVCEGLKISMSDLLDFDIDAKPTSEEAKHRIEKAMSSLSDGEAIRIAEIVENVVKFKADENK